MFMYGKLLMNLVSKMSLSCSLLQALEKNDSLLDLVVSTVQLVSQLRQLGCDRSQLGLVDVTSDQNTYCNRNDGSDFDATVD